MKKKQKKSINSIKKGEKIMVSNFRNKFWMFFVLVAVLAFLPLSARSQTVIDIQVSPNVLNLQNSGEVVTVHTDIAYGLVLGATVTLNDVEISWWKSDNQGNFVAKFNILDIKNLPLKIGELNTLVLSGTTINGDEFTGSYEVKVINVIPASKKK